MTLTQAIAALGETPEQVSAVLREKGIKGYRRVSCTCPIAKYLNACGFPIVTVGAWVNRYSYQHSDSSEEVVSLNAGIREWIRRFDDGEYPEFYLEA